MRIPHLTTLLKLAALAFIAVPLIAHTQTLPHIIPHTPAIERLTDPSQHAAAIKELTAMGAAAGPSLITALSDPHDTIRTGAAEVLRTLAKKPSQLPNWHPREFWEKRLTQLHPRMPEADALAILLPDLSPEQRNKTNISCFSSGGTSLSQYRLDDHWTVAIPLEGTVLHPTPPTLNASASSVWVKPPEKFTGLWTTWYINGQKCNSISYTNGQYDGLFESFRDNGSKGYQQLYVAGNAEGSSRGWHQNGKLAYQGQYHANQQDGLWTHWFDDGKLQMTATYKAGKWDGARTNWYPSGQKQYEEHYRLGVKDGLDRAWDENGKLQWQRFYINGQQVPATIHPPPDSA